MITFCWSTNTQLGLPFQVFTGGFVQQPSPDVPHHEQTVHRFHQPGRERGLQNGRGGRRRRRRRGALSHRGGAFHDPGLSLIQVGRHPTVGTGGGGTTATAAGLLPATAPSVYKLVNRARRWEEWETCVLLDQTRSNMRQVLRGEILALNFDYVLLTSWKKNLLSALFRVFDRFSACKLYCYTFLSL